MKKRLSLFTLAMVSVLSLTGCDYNYTYEIPSYPIEIEVDDPTKAILPEQIYLSSTKKSMVVGDTYNLLATVAPNNTTDKSLNWSSEDADVVAVGSDGLLTAIGEGTALVSAKSNAKGDVVASCEVRVASKEIHVESLELSTIEETMKVGSKLDIYANISPENATNKNIIWTSSDPEVVSVNGGKIEGISTGVAIITAATEDSNKIQTCTVTVDASEGGEIVAPTSITLNPTSKTVGIGDTFQLIAKVGPENVTDRSVNWKSSNEEVASVSATGSVKALKMGTSVITATASGNTSISATCIVNVTESTISVVAISLSESTKTLDEIKEYAKNYYQDSLKTRNKEKFNELFKFIKIRVKSLSKKLVTLDNAIKDANGKLNYQEIGSMLLAYSYDLDGLKEHINENNIEFDEKLSAGQNAEKYFKKYKKAKRTIEINQLEIEKTKKEIIRLEGIISMSTYMTDEELLIVAKELVPFKYKLGKMKKEPSFIGSVTVEGTKISFGKNAKANNELTFKIAKPFETYIHIKDFHGSHVIIHNANPTNEMLLVASEIALLLSNKNEGEVYYAQIKYVKKGSSLGEANLLNYKTITLKSIRNSTKELLNK